MVQALERPQEETQVNQSQQVQPQGIVIGHTHWDREWYLPFEGFRMRLVAMMDGLLDILERDENFRCFVLDGQTIMVDDYLEVRPEAAERVQRMVGQGRIKIGPWYTAVDTFLPDPESLVRNLHIGFWSARRHGSEPMPVGHLPDTFGFIGQMPQLLRHFGLRYAFAWRGFHPENEGGAFWWASPDGSRVLTMRPIEGYCEGAMGVVDPERFLTEILPGIAEKQDREPHPHRLFVVGCDHFTASPRLPWLAEQIGEQLDLPVRIGSLEEMAALLDPFGDRLPTVRGEQRDPCLAVCPASVCGTRVPLKQANQRVEALLLGVAEPLQALAELAGAGSDRAHLRWAWQILTQNHPHDSIPGCSIDEVHREMFTRFARAHRVAVDAVQRGAKRLAASLDPSVRGELGAIGVVGLTGGVGRLRLRLHGPDTGMPRFRIVEPGGREVPYVVVRRGKEHVYYHRLEDAFATMAKTAYAHFAAPQSWVDERRTRPETFYLPYADIEMEVEAPRAGYKILKIEPLKGRLQPGARVTDREAASRAEISNDQLRVWADERGLYVADQATSRSYGPVYFSHAGEAGDEYTAFPVKGEPPVLFAPDAKRAKVATDGLGSLLEMPISVTVPARLRTDRKRRTGRARLTGKIEVRLLDGRVEIDLSLLNRARDYDLRLVAHVPGVDTARSGAPFNVEDRAFEVDHSSPRAPQQMLPDFPFRGWVAAQDADGAGLAVLARGLYESAVRKVEGGVDVAMTLLRGVGHLSRDDLDTRPDHAGPYIATPDAQCLGPQQWSLALLPFGPGEADAIPAQCEQFLRPPATFPVQWVAGNAPAERNLFAGDDLLVVSALKPSESGEGATLHAHNPTRAERRAEVSGTRVRVDETPIDGDGTLSPFVIAAWRLGGK
ncbi:MAG TPA: hypothetical protein VGE04_10080 [Chloroflexia bacterium]